MYIFQNGLFPRLINEFSIERGSLPFYILASVLLLTVIVFSYLLGSISSAIIVSKVMCNDDVRKHGSGNAGLTNMLRTYGKGAAALTLLGDMLKTAVAILLCAITFGFSYQNGISTSGVCYLAGLCAVMGHVFPVFYGFKGGKGVLVTAVMTLILAPTVFFILIAIFAAVVAISGFVSLGSLTVATLYPIAICLCSYLMGGKIPTLTVICTLFLCLFVIWCHRTNIKRLLAGTEKKISVGKKKD